MRRRRRSRTGTPSSAPAEVLEDRQLLTGFDYGNATLIATDGQIAGPALTNLGIQGTGINVYPAFSPDTLRYSVSPTSATDGIRITPRANAGDEIRINGRLIGNNKSRTLLGLGEGESVSVQVTGETGTRTYELYHLPTDFPLEVIRNDAGASTGDIYMTPRAMDGTTFLAKIDGNGVPVFAKRVHHSAFDFKRHDNGMYSYGVEIELNEFEVRNFEIVLLDQDLNEVDRVGTVGPDMNQTDFHDFSDSAQWQPRLHGLQRGQTKRHAVSGFHRSGC